MADFKNLNDLAPELKILLVNAQVTLDDARSKMKEKGLSVDLTSRLQLRDDTKELERCIKKLERGKFKDKDVEKLRLAAIRLDTVVDGVFNR